MPRNSFRLTPANGSAMQDIGGDDLPEAVTVDLDDKDPNNFEVVEVDDTPENDRGRPTRVESSILEQEDDLRERVSSRTQKRFDRMKFETETERRGREAAERERDAAIEDARRSREEAARLRRIADTGNEALVTSMKTERENRINEAQNRLAQAHSDGDATAIAKATADLSQAQAELVAISTRPQRKLSDEPQPEPVQTRQAAPTLAPNVASWIAHNDGWFNKDRNKTEFAMSIHRDLVARGVQPASDEYTRELDKGLKAMYPDHKPFSGSSQRAETDDRRDRDPPPRRGNVVAEGSRETERVSANPRQVELTSSELAIARKLGVTPQAYAIEKLKSEQKRKGAQ